MTLLCIDDDPDDLEIFCEAVKKIDPSYICVVTHNGKEALEMLKTLTPDMVFLDINMPVMNGRDTLKVIRADKKFNAIPVYILSTYIPDDDAVAYRQMGAFECIKKPLSFSEFCQTLQDLFQKRVEICP